MVTQFRLLLFLLFEKLVLQIELIVTLRKNGKEINPN